MTPTLMKNNCSLHWIDARGMENGVSLDAAFSTKLGKYLLGGVKGGAQAPPLLKIKLITDKLVSLWIDESERNNEQSNDSKTNTHTVNFIFQKILSTSTIWPLAPHEIS